MLLVGAALPAFSATDEPSAPVGAPTEQPGDGVELDRLLQLPSSMEFRRERRKGVDATEWRNRFRETRTELAEAERDLAQSREQLDQVAATGGGQWQVAPPGSNQTDTSPMSFKLREEIRRNRERVEEARKKQRQLEIEADLAGVPEAWRND
jgi:hypothetical protein